MPGPDWASITTAVGTGVLGLTALVGVIAASNRVRRANGEVQADAFNGPDAVSAIRVRATVRSTGLGRLKLAEGADSPSITVTQVDLVDGQQAPVARWQKEVLAGEIVDPGEATAATFVFLVAKATPRTLGWEVSFQFGVAPASTTTKAGLVLVRHDLRCRPNPATVGDQSAAAVLLSQEIGRWQ